MSSDERGGIVAIVPVGTIDGAKSRLGDVLDAEEREALTLRLARRTIRSAVADPAIAETLVVTPDETIRLVALELGARPLRQRSTGLNEGLREARTEALAAGASAIVIVPIDLAAISADTLDVVVQAIAVGHEPQVVLVPDRHGRGTNALGLRPPDAIDVRFGGDSRQAHASAAEAAGIGYREIDGPLGLDLDTADDLLLAEAADPGLTRG